MEGRSLLTVQRNFLHRRVGNSDGRLRRGKRFGFRLYCLSPISSVLRYEDRGRRRGNRPVAGEKEMPWRVGALTKALLCGAPRWYRPLSGLGWYGNGSVAVDGGDEKKGRFALVQDFMVGLRCCFARTISNMCYRTLLSSRTITTTHRCPRRPSTTFRRARFSPMLQRCQNRGQCGALRCG